MGARRDACGELGRVWEVFAAQKLLGLAGADVRDLKERVTQPIDTSGLRARLERQGQRSRTLLFPFAVMSI
jgi:hypothetical protein